MTTRSVVADVPTGSDALKRASDVANLFRCRLESTGDDAERVTLQGLVEQFMAATTLVFARRGVGGPSGWVKCQASGDMLVGVPGDLGDRLEAVLLGGNLGLGRVFWGSERVDPGPVGAPARLLRDISQLDATRLGRLFGVSRTTYQQWLGGSRPRGKRLDAVVEVLTLMEEAAEVRGGGNLDIWLRTPVEAGGPSPLDLLGDGRYEAFRGFAHRVPIEQRMMRRPSVASRTSGVSHEEWSGRPERIAKAAWEEEGVEHATE